MKTTLVKRGEASKEFWKQMPQELREKLSKAAVRMSFKKDEHVFRQRDRYRGVYFIESGYFKWYTSSEDKHSIVIKIFEAGEM